MVLKLKIKSILCAILIALAVLAVFALGKTLAEGQYVIETNDFDSEIEWGDGFSTDGLTIRDNRTLGIRRIKVTDDMIARVDDLSTAGVKQAVILYEGVEYTVTFEVKYRVEFIAGGESVGYQLVGSISELVLPEGPRAPIGYTFSRWNIDTECELSGNLTVDAVFEEIEYPSLEGLTATYGDTLADVVLGSNEHGYWEFLDPADTSLGNAGAKELGVRFVYSADPTVFKYDYATVTVAKREFDFGTLSDWFFYDGEAHFPQLDTDIAYVTTGSAQTLPGTYTYGYEIIDDNYYGEYSGTFEIVKPTVIVRVSSATIVYPAAVPEFIYTVEGFDNVELLGIEIDAPEFATQIGEYDIGITHNNNNVNYIIHKGTLTVVKGELEVEKPEIGKVTYEQKLADVEFLGKYLGTWSWESPETVIDSMDGIVAYAIFVHDDPNLNPVRMAIEIGNVQKKTLTIEVTESTFTYEAGVERSLSYTVTGGMYPEIYETLTVLGNTPETMAGRYTKTLIIDDPRYEGSVTVELVIEKATPAVDFDRVYETVWKEDLRLGSIALPEGYAWQSPNYRITESGEAAYTAIFTPADTDNYSTVTGEITVRVAKAAVSVAGVLDSYEKTYDTNKFDIKSSGIAAYYTDGTLSIAYYKDGIEVDEIVNAGEYLLVITVTEGKNYLGTTIERLVTVSRATNTQTVLTEQSAVYLDSSDVLALPENIEGTWSWSQSNLGTVGTKKLIAVFTPDENANYLPREVEVTVTVSKRVLTAPKMATVLSYNGKAQSLGLESTALYTVTDLGGRDVGEYTATLTITDANNYEWANGTDTLTVTYSIVPVDNAFVYLPENGLSFPYLSSLADLIARAELGGVKIEYKRVGAYDHEYTETVPTDVGEYVVRYTTTDTNCTKILTETRTFTITPIEVIPYPSLLGTQLEYNGKKQTAALKDVVDGIYTVSDSGATNAGDIGTVTFTIYNENYVWADGSKLLTLTYEIVKAENSWTTEPSIDSSVTYGETPNVYGAAKYDNMLVYYRALGTDGEFILGLPDNAGEYEIMFTTDSVNAYAAEARYSTLTVSKKEIALPEANGSLVYNGEEQIGVATPSELYTVEGGTATNAGNYTATATILDPNYKWLGTDSDTVEITYSIAKAQGGVTVTKPNFEFTYSGESFLDTVKGGAEPANSEQTDLVFTVTSFVNFGGATILTDSITGAGEYVITVTVAETDNYLGASATITVHVAKKAVAIPTLTDKVYTGSAQSIGIADNELYTASGDVTATNVGSYSVTFTLCDPDNHEWLGSESDVFVVRGYSISTALNEWVVEPESITEVYNGSPVLVGATPLHGTVTIVYTLGGVVVDAPVSAGVYNVTVTAIADNYSELVAYRTVTITKATVDVPTAGEIVYNGNEQGITLTAPELGVLYTVYSETKATDAGTAASVTLKLTDSANYKWSTTASDTLTVSVTVAKANIEIDGTPTVKDWTFTEDETLPVSSVIAAQRDFPGLSVELLYALSADGEYMSYAQLPKTNGRLNAGTYYVKARVLGTSNYNGDETEAVTFTVEKCEISVPSISETALVFDGTAKYSGIAATALYTVLDNGGIAAGEYLAYLTLTDSTNYKWLGESTDTVTVGYEIAKFVFTDEHIDNGGKSAQYGDAMDLSATIIAQLSDVDVYAYVSYLYSEDGNVWYESLEALAKALNVEKLTTGSYLVKTTVADSDNWTGHSVTDTFVITKRAVALPTPETLTYNGSEQSAFAYSSLYTVEGGAATLAGAYTATLTLTDTENYTWQGTDSASAEISYTVAKANNAWATAPALSASTVTYKDGYTVSGAPLYDVLKIKYKSSTDNEYTLIASLNELPTDAGSYEIVLYTESVNAHSISATLNLTINRKTVTKPSTLPTLVYDGNEKTHGITVSEGFVIKAETTATNAGETVSVTLALASGNYVWSDGTAGDYTLTSVIAKATVTLGDVGVSDITYTELPAPTVSVDKAFATSLVGYLYSVDKVNYLALDELLAGGYLPAGTYWVKAYAESENVAYSESAAISFTVGKATPDSISIVWNGAESDGLFYQNLLSVNKAETTVTYNGVKVSVAEYSASINGAFAAEKTLYNITVAPSDTDNYNTATFTVTVPLKTVATIGHGGTGYGSVEAALNAAVSGETVWVIPDTTGNVRIVENVAVKAGVTLILPYGTGSGDYNADDTTDYANEQGQANANDSLCVTKIYVAEGVTLKVNGKLIISGEISSGNVYMNYIGHTFGKHARIMLESGAKIVASGTSSSKAVIKAFGFIKDASGTGGSVTVQKYADIYQPFVIRDYRNGGYLSSVYAVRNQYELSPFTRFELGNVESLTVYEYGSRLLGMVNINTSLGKQHAEGVIIGSNLTGDGVICLTSEAYSYVEVKYDMATDIAQVDIYGGAKSSDLDVSVLGMNMTTEDGVFPISYHFNITLNKADGQTEDAQYTMNQFFKLLPGATFVVGNGTVLNVDRMSIYATFDESVIRVDGENRYNTHKYPTDKAPAKLIVYGTLIANCLGGDVYTDGDGAKIIVNESTTVITHEVAEYIDSSWSSKLGYCNTVTNSLRLYYGDTLVRSQVILGVEYTSSAEKMNWMFELPDIVEVQLGNGYGVYTDFAVFTDENGEVLYIGTYDSRETKENGTLKVLKGATVTFYLTNNQLFSEKAVSSITLSAVSDMHTKESYTVDWTAANTSPVIYNVKAITVTGNAVQSLSKVSFVYNLSAGTVSVTFKSESAGLSSGTKFKVNGTTASSSGLFLKTYTYTTTISADTTLDVVKA